MLRVALAGSWEVARARRRRLMWITSIVSQLHPDERQLAKKMAANSQGTYTVEQLEAQMRLSDLVDMSGKVLESGRPDQIDAATTKPYDSGAQWVSVAAQRKSGRYKPKGMRRSLRTSSRSKRQCKETFRTLADRTTAMGLSPAINEATEAIKQTPTYS
ncbi:hypothetical protein CBM2633_B60326 [Cupriavidus taiwanensis]|nr:hypothetical protein CBM2633_B60326 [Cupriavidus taiwanensis]